MEIDERNRSQKERAMEKALQTTDAQPVAMTSKVSAQAQKRNSQDVQRTSSKVGRGHIKATANPAHGVKIQDLRRKADTERQNAMRENSPAVTVTKRDIGKNDLGKAKRSKTLTFRNMYPLAIREP
jgi:hypothetical protein